MAAPIAPAPQATVPAVNEPKLAALAQIPPAPAAPAQPAPEPEQPVDLAKADEKLSALLGKK